MKKVKYNKKLIWNNETPLSLPTKTINQGEVFKLIDGYFEGDNLVLGVKTSIGIEESVFKLFYKDETVRGFVEENTLPYIKNAEYITIK